MSDINDSISQARLSRVQNLERQVDYAWAFRRERERELAALGDEPPSPPFPWLLVALAGAGIAITFTLTLHDLVFASLFAVRTQALVAAFASAMLISGTVVSGQLLSANLDGPTPPRFHWFWTLLGIALGIALYFMRSSTVVTPGQQALAIGMSVLEVTLVLVVELTARRFRQARERFRKQVDLWTAALRQVEVARSHHEGQRLELMAAQERLERQVADRRDGGATVEVERAPVNK